MVRDGAAPVPNVAHVVSAAQPLYFYFEVYDPAPPKDAAKSAGQKSRVLINVTFYRAGVRVFETPLVESTRPDAADRHAETFQVKVPPGTLQAGYYICQVNVIDDDAGTFVFPRLAMYVRQ